MTTPCQLILPPSIEWKKRPTKQSDFGFFCLFFFHKKMSRFECHTFKTNNRECLPNIALYDGAGDEGRTRDVLLGKEVLYH
jgi:hypothetical protein